MLSERNRIFTVGSAALAVALCTLCRCGEAPAGGDASVGNSSGSATGSSHCGSGADCAMGSSCCGGRCVNTYNDPHNCGGCGVACGGAESFCQGRCIPTPCDQDAGSCGANACCGAQCCPAGQLCCLSTTGQPHPECYSPEDADSTCPIGCLLCQ
jgi:hypothetical protein